MKLLPSCAFLLVGTTLVGITGASADAQVIVNRAATVGESFARGAGEMIRAQGDANLANSQAAANYEHARSHRMDNWVKYVIARQTARELYKQRKAQEYYERAERVRRFLNNRNRPALASQRSGPTHGQIAWPASLKREQYREYRDALNELFARSAQQGGLSSDDYLKATTAANEWRTLLTKRRGAYPRNLHRQLVRFIVTLDQELHRNLNRSEKNDLRRLARQHDAENQHLQRPAS